MQHLAAHLYNRFDRPNESLSVISNTILIFVLSCYNLLAPFKPTCTPLKDVKQMQMCSTGQRHRCTRRCTHRRRVEKVSYSSASSCRSSPNSARSITEWGDPVVRSQPRISSTAGGAPCTSPLTLPLAVFMT